MAAARARISTVELKRSGVAGMGPVLWAVARTADSKIPPHPSATLTLSLIDPVQAYYRRPAARRRQQQKGDK